MSRLLVEAVSRERQFSDSWWQLALFVSVSRADDGTPVTGLELHQFRVCAPTGSILEFNLSGGYEAHWEPTDQELAGCYSLNVRYQWETKGPGLNEWTEGEFYPFGIQVRVPDKEAGVTHMGQTVVRVESLGK